jgi:putative peptide zinc metalloprotease protein
VAELEHRLTAAEASSPAELELVRQRLEFARNDLAEAERRLKDLTIRSPADGIFIVPRPGDLQGRYAAKGALLGYVMPPGRTRIRVAVPEVEIDTVRGLTRRVDVHLAGAAGDIAGARIVREVPGGTRRLPSPALGVPAGGPLPVDPSAKDGETSLGAFFEIDIELPDGVTLDRWGERAHVRFDHGATPLAVQFYRTIRQVFLTHFNV